MAEQAIAAVYRKDYVALDELLRNGGANTTDGEGRTLLMHAVLASDSDPHMIEYLIKQGADPNLADKGQRWTALHFAARDQKCSLVSVLLQYGADVNAIDAFGNTPLWRCVMSPPCDIETVRALLTGGADATKKNKHDTSPLDAARRVGNEDVVALLSAR